MGAYAADQVSAGRLRNAAGGDARNRTRQLVFPVSTDTSSPLMEH